MDEGKKDTPEAGGEEVGGAMVEGVPPKIDTVKRLSALGLDLGVAVAISGVSIVLGFILGFIPLFGFIVGPLVMAVGQAGAAAYLGLRDSLFEGRSFGKKAMKLTVQTPDGTPCTQEQSLRRNALLALAPGIAAIAMLIMAIPLVGWIIGPLVGSIAGLASLTYLYEGFQVLALDPNGRRVMELQSETYTVTEG